MAVVRATGLAQSTVCRGKAAVLAGAGKNGADGGRCRVKGGGRQASKSGSQAVVDLQERAHIIGRAEGSRPGRESADRGGDSKKAEVQLAGESEGE